MDGITVAALLFGTPFVIGLMLGRWWWGFAYPATVLVVGVVVAQQQPDDALGGGSVIFLTVLAALIASVSAHAGTFVGFYCHNRY